MRARALLAAFACACAMTAAAQPVVSGAPCEDVLVRSDGTGLHELLQALAEALGFELHYAASASPPVRLAGRHSPVVLMERLAADANLAVQYRADARCPGKLQVGQVWVLPVGTAAPLASAHALRPLPPAVAPVAQVPHSAGEQDYLRAHGFVPRASSSGAAPAADAAR